jgi:phosphoribosylformylglycinamidine cyclo-ligase
LDFGYYANVIDLGNGSGLAITTDGVGTKIIIAEQLGKYDTIGIDCVAMNVNDIICVGAEPLAMTDYIAVDRADARFFDEVAVGIARGAELAGITIPGGEIAQIGEVIRGFDLVGTCVGLVPVDRIIRGQDIVSGDAIVGFESSGIHSNGLTLARRVLLDQVGMSLESYVEELGRALGEELLEPTRIYVRLALRLLAETNVKALAHITSDGFLNLQRVDANVGFDIETLPESPPVFDLIQRSGRLSSAEMYLVYNMGIGFCGVVPEKEVDRVVEIAAEEGIAAHRIGTCHADAEKSVVIRPAGLRSERGHFVPE